MSADEKPIFRHGTFRVGVDYHKFFVGNDDADDLTGDGPTRSPLIVATPHGIGAWVTTGIHTGEVTVEYISSTTPQALDEDAWEDIAQAMVTAHHGRIQILEPMGGTEPSPNLVRRSKAPHVVRCAARGRDTLVDGVSPLGEEDPVESYRIDVWPARPEDSEQIIKLTSEYGRSYRQS